MRHLSFFTRVIKNTKFSRNDFVNTREILCKSEFMHVFAPIRSMHVKATMLRQIATSVKCSIIDVKDCDVLITTSTKI